MKKVQKVERRGGARPNSGPKAQTVSATQLKEMRSAAEKKAKKEGRGLFEVCLDWVYDNEISIDRRQAAWKMYCDKMLIAVSEGSEGDKLVGPAVFLPEQHPRLKLVEGGGKEKKEDEGDGEDD